jgi:hypothetical protein
LETLSATVDFEIFRPVLRKALKRVDPPKGGRPGFDPVLKFEMLVLQSMHGLFLEQTKFLVRDRLSWMRFCRLGRGDAAPDANTLRDSREALVRSKALERAFARPDRAINRAGYTPMGRQIGVADLRCAPAIAARSPPRPNSAIAGREGCHHHRQADNLWRRFEIPERSTHRKMLRSRAIPLDPHLI